MFEKAFQGAPAFEILSPQGANPLANWKVNGVQRQFDKTLKGYVFHICGLGAMRLPRDDRPRLGLVQPILVLQVFLTVGKPFSVEIGITDDTITRRRLLFSSAFKEMSTNPLHARFPLIDTIRQTRVKRNCWVSLCFDIESIVQKAWPGNNYKTLDSIQISPDCKLRKVYTLRDAQPLEDDTLLHLQDGITALTQVIDGSDAIVEDDRATPGMEYITMGSTSTTSAPPPIAATTTDCFGYDELIRRNVAHAPISGTSWAHGSKTKVPLHTIDRRSPKIEKDLRDRSREPKPRMDCTLPGRMDETKFRNNKKMHISLQKKEKRDHSLPAGRQKFGSTSGNLTTTGFGGSQKPGTSDGNVSPTRRRQRPQTYGQTQPSPNGLKNQNNTGSTSTLNGNSLRLSKAHHPTNSQISIKSRDVTESTNHVPAVSVDKTWDDWDEAASKIRGNLTAVPPIIESPTKVLEVKERELAVRTKRLAQMEKMEKKEKECPPPVLSGGVTGSTSIPTLAASIEADDCVNFIEPEELNRLEPVEEVTVSQDKLNDLMDLQSKLEKPWIESKDELKKSRRLAPKDERMQIIEASLPVMENTSPTKSRHKPPLSSSTSHNASLPPPLSVSDTEGRKPLIDNDNSIQDHIPPLQKPSPPLGNPSYITSATSSLVNTSPPLGNPSYITSATSSLVNTRREWQPEIKSPVGSTLKIKENDRIRSSTLTPIPSGNIKQITLDHHSSSINIDRIRSSLEIQHAAGAAMDRVRQSLEQQSEWGIPKKEGLLKPVEYTASAYSTSSTRAPTKESADESSYDKRFGLKELSDNTLPNLLEKRISPESSLYPGWGESKGSSIDNIGALRDKRYPFDGKRHLTIGTSTPTSSTPKSSTPTKRPVHMIVTSTPKSSMTVMDSTYPSRSENCFTSHSIGEDEIAPSDTCSEIPVQSSNEWVQPNHDLKNNTVHDGFENNDDINGVIPSEIFPTGLSSPPSDGLKADGVLDSMRPCVPSEIFPTGPSSPPSDGLKADGVLDSMRPLEENVSVRIENDNIENNMRSLKENDRMRVDMDASTWCLSSSSTAQPPKSESNQGKHGFDHGIPDSIASSPILPKKYGDDYNHHLTELSDLPFTPFRQGPIQHPDIHGDLPIQEFQSHDTGINNTSGIPYDTCELGSPPIIHLQYHASEDNDPDDACELGSPPGYMVGDGMLRNDGEISNKDEIQISTPINTRSEEDTRCQDKIQGGRIDPRKMLKPEIRPFTPPMVPVSQLLQQPEEEQECIEVMFDPLLDVYFDPVTNKYYELKGECH